MTTTKRRRYLLFNLTCLVITAGVLMECQGCFSEDESENWSSDFEPSIAMANGNLVFVGHGKGGSDIYRFDLTNGKVIPLTETDAEERDVAISRDGTKIAYVQFQGQTGSKIIYSNIDGSERSTVGLNAGNVSCPMFSEKGDAILYARANSRPSGYYLWEGCDLHSYSVNDYSTRKITNKSFLSISCPQFLNQDTIIFSYSNRDSSGRPTTRSLSSVNLKSGAIKFGKDVFGNTEFASYGDIYVHPLKDRKFMVFLGSKTSSEYTMKVIQKKATGNKVLLRENDLLATSVVEGTNSLLMSSQAPSSKENSGLLLFSLKDGKKTKIAGYDFFRHPSSDKITRESLTALRSLQVRK